MNWLKAFFASSVGRKYVMGATGLFLCFFLVVHLAGNLMIYAGFEVYDEYAHKLHSNPEFLVLAEILLFSALAFHIAYGIWLTFSNREARTERYAFQKSKRKDRVLTETVPTSDKTMFLTGLVILMFLIMHLNDFKIQGGWETAFEGATPSDKVQIVLSHTFRGVLYLIGAVFVGIHVSHGLQSAFQSLGVNHPKYTPTIKYASWLFGLVVAVGFGSFPIVAWISGWSASPEVVPQVGRVVKAILLQC
ncbi:succinate dehydrogenase cytochrome b subunit [Planctomicrobium sp. SH668]|uniref:succinate dehydrogenase cytochrome b subunit n=1 Tax=Planctomicrobium sp. SH668 TaxID=3448126 RepID=UPI003F5BC0B6